MNQEICQNFGELKDYTIAIQKSTQETFLNVQNCMDNIKLA